MFFLSLFGFELICETTFLYLNSEYLEYFYSYHKNDQKGGLWIGRVELSNEIFNILLKFDFQKGRIQNGPAMSVTFNQGYTILDVRQG